MAQSQNQNQGNPNVNSELESFIGYAIVALISIVGFMIFVQHIAWVARYVFAPFSIPVWSMGQKLGTFGSVVTLLVFAGLCVGLFIARPAIRKLTKGRLFEGSSYFWLSYAVLFGLLAGAEILTGASHSLLTSHVDRLCNPSSTGFGAIFTCQATVADIQQLGTANIIIMSFIPNLVLAWPNFYTVIMGLFRVLNEHPFSHTRKVHNVDSFIKEQKIQYAHLRYYDIVNPNDLPDHDGPLRLMDDSRMFIFQNDLVSNFTVRPNLADSSNFGKLFGQTPIPPDLSYYDFKKDDMVPVLDPVKFERLMSEQLGEPWTGVDNLPASVVIVLSVALPRACCLDESISSKEADDVKAGCEKRIDQVWTWAAKQLLLPEEETVMGLEAFPHLDEYKDVIRQWLDHRIAKQILSEHAYVSTILYRALEDSKKIGVMQPSNFRYLKEYDRTTWAIVQNVNRPSAFAENIATVAHYREERREGVGINKPGFQSAYNGLLDRIREFNYTKEQVSAWYKMKTEGDPSDMIALSMISSVNNVFDVVDKADDGIEEAEYEEV